MPRLGTSSIAAAVAFVALLCGARPPSASRSATASQRPSFEEQQRADVERNPPDVQFHLNLTARRPQFHRGEIIRVDYDLSSSAPGKYKFGARKFNGSDRSELETFHVDRLRDAPDPLAGFWPLWESLLCLHFTGQWGASRTLSQDPTRDTFLLNEYLRFDRPGKYRLYATTRQVVEATTPSRDSAGPPISSNAIELEVLPDDPEWQAKELRKSVDALRDPLTPPNDRAQAAQQLKFIPSPDAARSMAELYTGDKSDADTALLAGLIGFQDRLFAIQVMEQHLDASGGAVSRFFLLALAVLKYRVENPDVVGSDLDTSSRGNDPRRRDFLDVLATLIDHLETLVDRKPPRARALTADTMFMVAQERPCFSQPGDRKTTLARLADREISILPDLPPYEQSDRLANFGWAKGLEASRLSPPLRQIYLHPSTGPHSNPDQIRKYALKDIAALNPEEARRLMSELVSRPGLGGETRELARLSLAPSLQLDTSLIERLEARRTEDMMKVAPLIAAYASPAILERAKRIYEVEGAAWPCAIEAGLLAYFLRVDPGYAALRLPDALRFAAQRQSSSCSGSLLNEISELNYSEPVQKAVVAQLDDPSLALQADAARILGRHPSDVSEAALLSRFRKLKEEWKGPAALTNNQPGAVEWTSHHALEEALVSALLRQPNYRRNPDHIRSLSPLCISDLCRAKVESSSKENYAPDSPRRPEGLV